MEPLLEQKEVLFFKREANTCTSPQDLDSSHLSSFGTELRVRNSKLCSIILPNFFSSCKCRRNPPPGCLAHRWVGWRVMEKVCLLNASWSPLSVPQPKQEGLVSYPTACSLVMYTALLSKGPLTPCAWSAGLPVLWTYSPLPLPLPQDVEMRRGHFRG